MQETDHEFSPVATSKQYGEKHAFNFYRIEKMMGRGAKQAQANEGEDSVSNQNNDSSSSDNNNPT